MSFISVAARRLRHLMGASSAVLALGALPLAAQAQAQAAPADGAQEAIRLTQQWLDDLVARTQPAGGNKLRMEVSVGSLDERLRLAPCARVEPYLPTGTRLWGRTRLGLRCIDGAAARWNVFLPITVKAFGPGWVLRGAVPSGTVLTADDAVQEEVDWAAEASAVLVDPDQWVGMVVTRPLSGGQALRQTMLKPPQVFAVGAQVRVVAQGNGFQVTSDGQAVSSGVIGQTARVRMDNGRVMSGVVLDKNTVRIDI